jgi:VWFA-related protein
VNEVQLSFTALHRGHFVADLGADDLKLLDDNEPPARIGSFWKTEDLALKIAFVVDASGSVATSFRTEQRSATRFVEKLLRRRGDEAAIVSFTAEPHIDQPFTADHNQVAAAIKQLHATQQGTAIFDAVLYACERLRGDAHEVRMRRAMVLITDGDDNASHANLVDAIREAQQSDIVVYVVQVNSGIFGKRSAQRAGLQTLADETGGKLFVADVNFSPAFRQIEEELRFQYVLTYTPAQWRSDGRFRRITLRALRSGIRIHCRPGYYAAAKKSE